MACLKARLDRGTKADAAVEEAANSTPENIVKVFICILEIATSSSSFGSRVLRSSDSGKYFLWADAVVVGGDHEDTVVVSRCC